MEPPEDFFKRLDEHLYASLKRLNRERRRRRFVSMFNDHSKRFILSQDHIWWITVEDEIIQFHTPAIKERNLHRKGSLQSIAEQLDEEIFFRVNKNTLINVTYVIGADWDHHEIIMENSITFHFTPTYYDEVKQALAHLL